MPFSDEFIAKATKEYKVRSVETDFVVAKELLEKAVALVAKNQPKVRPGDVEIYMHGSYANQTNIYFPSDMEIVVELKTNIPKSHYRIHNNYFVEVALDFTPQDFSELFFAALTELTEGRATQHDKWIEIPKSNTIKHKIEVVPAFSFNYTESAEPVVTDPTLQVQPNIDKVFRGILLWDAGVESHIVTFPTLHQKHGHAKNLATNGGFLRMTRLFKTLNKVGQREADFDRIRGYFVQCLLFNVPNALFIHDDPRSETTPEASDRIVFYKILNFLLNTEIDDFACQNLVWELFGSAEEFWKLESGRDFIKNIKNLYTVFPESRTALA